MMALRKGFSAVGMLGVALLAGPCRADGAALYATHCVACHQPDGEGAPGLAPPLAGTLARRGADPRGREYLAQVLVSGMVGTITARGVKFNGNMPTFAALPDAQLAALLGYVLDHFNGVPEPVDAALFAAARSRALPSAEVARLRGRVVAEIGE